MSADNGLYPETTPRICRYAPYPGTTACISGRRLVSGGDGLSSPDTPRIRRRWRQWAGALVGWTKKRGTCRSTSPEVKTRATTWWRYRRGTAGGGGGGGGGGPGGFPFGGGPRGGGAPTPPPPSPRRRPG